VSLWQSGCFAGAGKVFVGAIGFKRPKFTGGFFALLFSLLPAPTSFGSFEVQAGGLKRRGVSPRPLPTHRWHCAVIELLLFNVFHCPHYDVPDISIFHSVAVDFNTTLLPFNAVP
jgi:hypothetical protein